MLKKWNRNQPPFKISLEIRGWAKPHKNSPTPLSFIHHTFTASHEFRQVTLLNQTQPSPVCLAAPQNRFSTAPESSVCVLTHSAAMLGYGNHSWSSAATVLVLILISVERVDICSSGDYYSSCTSALSDPLFLLSISSVPNASIFQ